MRTTDASRHPEPNINNSCETVPNDLARQYWMPHVHVLMKLAFASLFFFQIAVVHVYAVILNNII